MRPPFPPTLDPVTATDALATLAGLPVGQSRMTAATITLARVATLLAPTANRHLTLRPSHEVPGGVLRQLFVKHARTLAAPQHLAGMPACFSPHSAVAHTPDLDLLALPGGYLVNQPIRPLVLTGHGDTVVSDYGTVYAGLAQHYDIDLARLVADAPTVNGTLICIADDVAPLNFCHWMVDWLPRLAALGELATRPSTYVAVPPLTAAYQWETLRLCGFSPERVVQLQPWQAVRARHLLVTSDVQSVPHPGHKAAPWLLNWLRATLGYGAFLDGLDAPKQPGRLYISRRSAQGRRVLNEDALLAALAPLGYRVFDPSGLPIAAQIAAFAGATHIVAPHGAGLATLAFANPRASLLELFPASYGTPAYYVLAAGLGLGYASYVTDAVTAGARPQLDDMTIDVADVMARCAAAL